MSKKDCEIKADKYLHNNKRKKSKKYQVIYNPKHHKLVNQEWQLSGIKRPNFYI